MNNYRKNIESSLLSGKRINARFTAKSGEARQMLCSIAPRQPKGFTGGLYAVIEHTATGDKFKSFNMDTLINE